MKFQHSNYTGYITKNFHKMLTEALTRSTRLRLKSTYTLFLIMSGIFAIMQPHQLIQLKFSHRLVCSVSGIWEQDYVSQDCLSLHAQSPLLVCFTCIYFNSAYVVQASQPDQPKFLFTGQLHEYFSNWPPQSQILVTPQ